MTRAMTRGMTRVPARAPAAAEANGAAQDAAEGAAATAGTGRALAPLHDPTALFVPDLYVTSSVPVALHLIEFLPASMKASYERTPQGTIALEEDRFVRRTFESPQRVLTVEAHFDTLRGRVTTHDWDVMFALFRLWDDGRVAPDGSFEGVTWSAVLDAAGRLQASPRANAENLAAAKRALARFAGARIVTRMQVDYRAQAAAVQEGGRKPVLPEAWPDAIEKEGSHWVLEYDIEREVRADGSRRERIEHLRINPLWLAQATAGKTAWLNIDLHNRLRSPIAKQLVALGTVRAAKNLWRVSQPWATTARELEELLGLAPGRPLNRVHGQLEEAFAVLATEGALHVEAEKPRGRKDWWYTLHMGDDFLIANRYRGIQPYDAGQTRALLWHLRSFGIGEAVARDLLTRHASAVLDTLRRAYYLQIVHGGRERPEAGAPRVGDWGAWVRRCIERNASWEDAAFVRWVDDVVHGRVRLAGDDAVRLLTAGVATPATAPRLRAVAPAPVGPDGEGAEAAGAAATAGEAPTPVFPDNVWGACVARQFAAARPWALMYLVPTRLVRVEDEAVVVGVPDEMCAEAIARRAGEQLAQELSDALGRRVRLRFEVDAMTVTTDGDESGVGGIEDASGHDASGHDASGHAGTGDADAGAGAERGDTRRGAEPE